MEGKPVTLYSVNPALHAGYGDDISLRLNRRPVSKHRDPILLLGTSLAWPVRA